MTWSEFKLAVEAAGATDDVEISRIVVTCSVCVEDITVKLYTDDFGETWLRVFE
jgi:hypothetical protein